MRELLMTSAICMVVTTVLTAVVLPLVATRQRTPINWGLAACLFLAGLTLGLTVAFHISWWATS